jgi:6-pyruvoyltetrahydropterin/6-carboxytetrahydropterin synthase
MQIFTVTKQIELDYGHRVPNHSSKCRNAHGHRGRIEVTVAGPLILEGESKTDEGMVLDFSAIKEYLEDVKKFFDHRFIISVLDIELVSIFRSFIDQQSSSTNEIGNTYLVNGFGWIQEMSSVPTAENLAFLVYKMLSDRVNKAWVNRVDKNVRTGTYEGKLVDGLGVDIWVESVRFWETPNSVAEYSLSVQRNVPIRLYDRATDYLQDRAVAS